MAIKDVDEPILNYPAELVERDPTQPNQINLAKRLSRANMTSLFEEGVWCALLRTTYLEKLDRSG